jgi:hypothetical protein
MAPSSVTDWITAIAASFGVVGLFYAAKQAKVAAEQTRLLKQQLHEDHERSRRQAALELVWRFTEQIKGTSSADLIEGIAEPNTVRKILNCEPVELTMDDRQINALRVCLKGTSLEADTPTASGAITLSREAVSAVQTAALGYLNVVESVLFGWQHNVADKTMIESQFEYLFDSTRGRNCLKLFREAAGGDRAFPAIAAFEQHWNQNIHARSRGKPELGA